MGDVLRDMSLAALTQAVEANLTAFHVALSDWPEITLHRDNDRIWTVSQRRFSLCNVVLVARFTPTEVDAQIERASAPYLASNVNVMWKLGPSTQPRDLGDRLLKQGFFVRPTLRGMALNLVSVGPIPVLASGVDIREVRDAATLGLWRRAVAPWLRAGMRHRNASPAEKSVTRRHQSSCAEGAFTRTIRMRSCSACSANTKWRDAER